MGFFYDFGLTTNSFLITYHRQKKAIVCLLLFRSLVLYANILDFAPFISAKTI